MAVVVHQCPHCRANHVSFRVSFSEQTSEGQGNIYYSCPACRKPISARVRRNAGKYAPFSAIASTSNSLNETGYEVVNIWPKLQEIDAPGSLPESVERSFKQAEEARARDHRESAGMSYRRSIELALKDIGPETSGTFYQRINTLAGHGKLTPALAEWAHSVRELGNEAAHDGDEPSKSDTDDLGAFSRVLLEYLYTMPAKVRRAEAD